MYISWYGQSSFKLQDKEVTILLDPHSARKAGLRGPNFKSEIVVLSDETPSPHALKDLKDSFIINCPGEYEVKGVFILGSQVANKKIVYQIDIDNIRIGYLGELNQLLTDNELERIDDLDVLILPVGDRKSSLSTKDAAEIIREIEPKIIIPSCYQVPGLKIDVDPVDKFLKEMGIKKFETEEKLRVVKKELSEDDTRVVILKLS